MEEAFASLSLLSLSSLELCLWEGVCYHYWHGRRRMMLLAWGEEEEEEKHGVGLM